MPLVGFRCPDNVPTAGNENAFEHCIYECPHKCMPTGVLYATWQQNAHNVHKGDMISPTSLPRCPRKLVLTRKEDYYEEPRKLFDATRGTLVHGFLETPGLKGAVNEARIYKTITRGPYAPWTISGQIDAYFRDRKKLDDYKTFDDKALFYMANHGAKEDHVMQLNCYRWLMWGGFLGKPDGEQVFWEVEDAQLHYLSMRAAYSTGTPFNWLVTDFKEPNRGKKYACEVGRKMIGKTRRGVPQWCITLRFPEVPLLPLESVEDYIVARGPALVRGFREEDHIPEGVLHDPESQWECDWCPVRDKCNAIEDARVREQNLKLDFETPLPKDEEMTP